MDRAAIQKLIAGPIGAIPTPFDDDFELDLGVMNADGSGQTRLTKTNYTRESSTAWSP